MNQEFIKVKNLQGELVLSHRKGRLGTSITTKEIYFQKPHYTYHILFEDIISMIPYQLEAKQTSFTIADELEVKSEFSHHLYKIKVAEMIVINRNGRFLRQNADLILPLSKRFLEKVRQYSKLTALPT